VNATTAISAATANVTREEVDTVIDDVFGVLMDAEEVKAGSGKTNKFTLENVLLAERRIDAAGVLPAFAKWRTEDRHKKRGGGRKPILNDRHIMVAVMMLRAEGAPMHLTELTNLFWFRLTQDAKVALGLDGVRNLGINEQDMQNWYYRVWRSFHSMLDLMDAWPMPNRAKNVNIAERAAIRSARDKNLARLKTERINWFSNAMLEMTIQAQPEEMRELWGGAISIDQTSMRATSQNGRRARNKKTDEEIPLYNKRTGEEVHKWAYEIDADYYPKRTGLPKDSSEAPANKATSPMEYEWAFTANYAIQTDEHPGEPTGHPHLIVSASLSTPNKDIGGEVVRAVTSVLDRGHHISRLTTDRGYGPNLTIDNFHLPLKALGIPLVMDYDKNQKGINGGHGGAIQVEGAHYCPATPEQLLNATPDIDQSLIDYHTYKARIEERRHYKLRAKEKPDETGTIPMMCPAYGPGATVECPLRAIHEKSSKKPKPLVRDDLVPDPDKRPAICTQTSVAFGPEVGVKFEQAPHYGSTEWELLYKSDRQTIESHNEYIKIGPEQLHEPRNRRVRGQAAQWFAMTMGIVSVNLRRIARALRELNRLTPKKTYPRLRDTDKRSRYVRWREKVETTTARPRKPRQAAKPKSSPRT
jgi:hypothetical protein